GWSQVVAGPRGNGKASPCGPRDTERCIPLTSPPAASDVHHQASIAADTGADAGPAVCDDVVVVTAMAVGVASAGVVVSGGAISSCRDDECTGSNAALATPIRFVR
ncbi:hypothetical protein Vretifemale_14030, partial [Volvox reticuliferus]